MSSDSSETASNTAAAEADMIIPSPEKHKNQWLLPVYCICSAVGMIGGPSLQRLYYMQGGTHKWLSSWFQSIGFFILLPVLAFLYLKTRLPFKLFFMDLRLFFSSAIIGLIIGLCNYLYSVGISRLPISTSSLLLSTQLAFTALFAFMIVKQKFTFYTINSVLVIIFGVIVLGLHTSSDRPASVAKDQYLLGFLFTLGGAALWGLSSPLIELAYSKSSKPVNYLILLQVLLVVNMFAALFCTVGTLFHKDFKVIRKEAREFSLGEKKYYMILVGGAIVSQLTLIGTVGIVSCKSSLFLGIFNSGLLPVTEVAAVIIFHEKFTGAKGLSLALSLWGFTSYFIGEHKKNVITKVKAKPIGENSIHDRDQDAKIDVECPEQIEMTRSCNKFEIQEMGDLSQRI